MHTLAWCAARRQYDRARDKKAVSRDMGMDHGGDGPPTPPTCVDVEVPLHQLFRGTVKSVRFARRSWDTWAQHEAVDERSYQLKINRGMLEGATFWFKGEGHQERMRPRTDLVFVIVQTPHPAFERIGDDLWHYVADGPALPARALMFARLVPTIDGHHALARGNTLAALLGFDRSGVGEAVVSGFGMPLRDEVGGWSASRSTPAAERVRGDLVVKFPIELPPARDAAPRLHVCADALQMPPVVLLTSADRQGAPLDPMASGSLVRHTLLPELLSFAYRHWKLQQRAARLATEAATVLGEPPPTSAGGAAGGVAVDVGDPECNNAPTSFVGAAPVNGAAVSHAVAAGADPEVATRTVMRWREEAKVAARAAAACRASDALHGVYLHLGSHYVSSPASACARQLMAAVSAALPQFRWTHVQMVRGAGERPEAGDAPLASPLLDDEEALIASAALVVIEASPDGLDATVALPTSPGGSTDSMPPPKAQRGSRDEAPFASDRTELQGALLGTRDYRVCWAPGVRVRSAPSSDAPVLRRLRAGQVARGASRSDGWVALLEGGWLRMDDGSLGALLDDPSEPACAAPAPRVPRPRPGSGESPNSPRGTCGSSEAQAEAEAAAEAAAELAAAAAEAEAAAGAKLLATEEEEQDQERLAMSESALRAEEMGAVQASGSPSALHLLESPSSLGLYRCHQAGGLLIGIDRGAALLGRRASRSAAVTVARGTDGKAAREAARQAAEAAARLPGQWPALLPYLVGLSSATVPADPANPRRMWRRLRGGATRCGLHDCALGFCVLGLPPGCVLVAASAKRFAPFSGLGSAQPLRITRAELDEGELRREARRERRKLQRQRGERLHKMMEVGIPIGDAARQEPLPENRTNPHSLPLGSHSHYCDLEGHARGPCLKCDDCPGYARPQMEFDSQQVWLHYCAGCGCAGFDHALE